MTGGARIHPVGRRLTEADTRRLVAGGLLALCHRFGVERVALEIGANEKTVRTARDQQSSLKLHSVLNLLSIDAAALDPLLAAYGFRLVSLEADPIDELAVLAVGARLTSMHSDALADGTRDHQETLRIADQVRAVTAGYQPILDEADRIRGLSGETR